MIKRRRKSTRRPRSGNRISPEQHDKLREAYFKSGSISAAAEAAGICTRTAARYVNEGDGLYLPLKDRVEDVQRTLVAVQDAEEVMRRRMMEVQMHGLMDRAFEAMQDMELSINSIRDPDGNPILNENGKVEMSLKDFREYVHLMRDLNTVWREIRGESAVTKPIDGARNTTNIQINTLDPTSVQAAAGKLLSSFVGNNMGQPHTEQALKATLAKTATRRIQTAEVIDVDGYSDS